MKNWKTTLGGIVGGLGMACLLSPDPRFILGGKIAVGVAVTWLGYHAADKTPAAPTT